MTNKCPVCGLINPENAQRCECGHVFFLSETIENKIESISKKISILSKDFEWYRTELNELKTQVEQLKYEKFISTVQPVMAQPQKEKVEVVEIKKEPPVAKIPEPESIAVSKLQQTFGPPRQTKKPKLSFSLEEYIGGNIINKIGIAILVIGIAIGVKYANDAGLISPLTWIVFGYLAGAGILATALKLKKKYEKFSAVVLSGGMASLYFTTFAAYSYYGLIPQVIAFAVMVIFTSFTVFAATVYNRQEIGIFGLVGAYGIPFLLGGDTGRAEILFAYMAIINVGILALSIRKYWNILNYVAFSLSWIIFFIWFFLQYNPKQHQIIAIVFSSVFFIIFYLNFIAYKTINKEKFNAKDGIFLLINSFIYFGVGYTIFNRINDGMYLGLFTLINAVIHLFFSYAVYKNKQLDRKLFYLLMGLVICFVTIAIPIQLNGNWVTLFWTVEIFVLFWVGRIKNVRFYEWLSFIMIIPAITSLSQDWIIVYSSTKAIKPFLNVTFLTSLMMIGSLAGVFIFNKMKPLSFEASGFVISRTTKYFIPIVLFLITYFTFCLEISNFWHQKYQSSAVELDKYRLYDEDLLIFGRLWLLNYTALFMAAFTFLSIKKLKHPGIIWSALCLSMLAVILIISIGLSDLSTLRSHYLSGYNSKYYYQGKWYIYFRYVCFAFLSLPMCYLYLLSKMDMLKKIRILKVSSAILNFFILIVLSSELKNLMILSHPKDVVRYEILSHGVGYTVLWGIYSLGMIAFGIWKKKKWIRIPAIVLFGITLFKLLGYDISGLATSNKVIAFIALGVILLVVSFLYQKFKNIILSNDE